MDNNLIKAFKEAGINERLAFHEFMSSVRIEHDVQINATTKQNIMVPNHESYIFHGPQSTKRGMYKPGDVYFSDQKQKHFFVKEVGHCLTGDFAGCEVLALNPL